MTKKNLSGLDALLGEENPKKDIKGKEKKEKIEAKNTDIEQRATFVIYSSVLENIKAIAYWDRKKQKDVLHEALSEYISKYKKKHGEIKKVPNRG